MLLHHSGYSLSRGARIAPYTEQESSMTSANPRSFANLAGVVPEREKVLLVFGRGKV